MTAWGRLERKSERKRARRPRFARGLHSRRDSHLAVPLGQPVDGRKVVQRRADSIEYYKY